MIIKTREISLVKLFVTLLMFFQCTGVNAADVMAEATTAHEKLTQALNEDERNWLASHNNIRIGVDAEYAPYSYRDSNGNYIGLAVDYLQLLSDQLDVNFEIVPDLSWPQIIEGVQNRSLDAIATAVATPEREKFLAFSEMYISTPLVIMARTRDTRISDKDDLAGKKVALVKGYSSTEKVVRESVNIAQYQVETVLDGLRAVATGDADAFVGVLGTSVHQARKAGIINLKVAAPYDMSENGQRFAIRSDWSILANIINKALTAIPESKHINLYRKWVPVEQAPETPRPATLEFRLTPGERKWLDSAPTVRIGIDPEWAPVEFIDERGVHSGISRDYIKQLERLLGIRFEMTRTDTWADVIEKIRGDELDLAPAIAPTSQRREFLGFTDSYLSLPVMVFADQGAEYVKQLSELAGKRVAVVRESAIDNILTLNHPELDLVHITDTSKGLSKVVKSEVDAFVGNMVTTGYYLGRLGYSQVKIITETPYRLNVSMAVKKENKMLLSIMNKALASISEAQQTTIYRRWVTLKYEHGFDYSLLWKVLAVGAVLIFLFAYWNWRLKKEVVLRTRLQSMADEARQRIQAIMENLEDAVVVVDENNIIESVSPSVERMFGYIGDEAVNQHVSLIVPEPHGHGHLEHIQSYIRKEENTTIGQPAELKGERKDGTTFPINIVVTQAHWQNQRYFVAVIRDITTQKRDEEVKELLRKRLVDAIESLEAAIVMYDYNDQLVICNQKYKDIYPKAAHLMIAGTSQEDILEEVCNGDRDCAQRQMETHREYKKDQLMLMNSNWFLISDFQTSDGGLVTLHYDITDIKRLQEKLEAVNKDLQMANIKLRELDQLKSMFIASVSHELRTPLNSIIGFSGMMKKGAFGKLDDKYQDYIERINKSGQHLLGLITDIIDISKIESGRIDVELSDFSLVEIVNEGIETIRNQAENKGLRLEIDMPKEISMFSDSRRLYQCVLNFLSNAMKFTEQGIITVILHDVNDDVLITVKDTGIGIGAEDQLRLFEPFERVDTHLRVKAGGTGLGLYLTKKIVVELLHGEIGMESKLGEGSLFWIRVPKSLKPVETYNSRSLK